mgnify:CR=1 FL=1
MAKLKVGEKIPDFLAVTVFDGEKPFSSRVGEGKTAIIFFTLLWLYVVSV